VIRLTANRVLEDRAGTDRLGDEFRENGCTLLAALLDPALLRMLQPYLRDGNWTPLAHEGIGTEEVLEDPAAVNLLHFCVNDPVFLEAIGRLTGERDLTWFGGRIYRLAPAAGHHDSWHDDVTDGRLIGMSINLSEGGYEGGLFEMRDTATRAARGRITRSVFGDASLFRISPVYQHRVGPLTGTRPRVAFAGWFHAGSPPLLSRAKPATGSEDAASPSS
jgi:hypothetical protein